MLDSKQTLYSLRHTASIKVFEENRLSAEAPAVDGSFNNASIPNLLKRLEIKQLDIEDLPEL